MFGFWITIRIQSFKPPPPPPHLLNLDIQIIVITAQSFKFRPLLHFMYSNSPISLPPRSFGIKYCVSWHPLKFFLSVNFKRQSYHLLPLPCGHRQSPVLLPNTLPLLLETLKIQSYFSPHYSLRSNDHLTQLPILYLWGSEQAKDAPSLLWLAGDCTALHRVGWRGDMCGWTAVGRVHRLTLAQVFKLDILWDGEARLIALHHSFAVLFTQINKKFFKDWLRLHWQQTD